MTNHILFSHTIFVFLLLSSQGVVYQNSMYIFGGYDQHGFICDAIYQYNFEANIWTKVKYSMDSLSPSDLERFHHDCVVYKNVLLVFGGKGPSASYNDLLEFNFETKRWRKLDGVGERPSGMYNDKFSFSFSFYHLFVLDSVFYQF
jgi:N-acetylneuraminic acid mutarotase